MPVLVEMMTLIAPEAPLRRALEAGGLDLEDLGASGVAGDGLLLALHFHRWPLFEKAEVMLADAGLELRRDDDEPGDLAAVDQRRGPLAWWPWLEVALVKAPAAAGGGQVLAARWAGTGEVAVAVPRGWTHGASASARFGHQALRLVDRPLLHLRREAGGDLYRDRWTGEEVRFPRKPSVTVVVEGEGGRRAEVRAERVVDGLEVELGLMFREVLPPGTGMLFDFRRDRPHGFWMKNTLVPLDLLFVDAGGRVVNVAEGARPLSTLHHRSAGPVRRVLEVPAGWCRETGLGAGARVRLEGGP